MRKLTVVLGCLTVATICPAQTPTWTQINPSPSPSARAHPAMAHDLFRGRTVLFGGQSSGGGLLNDTWEYDGKWVGIRPLTSPPVRTLHSIVFDVARRNTVLFGGSQPAGSLGDTWTWNGTDWKRMRPTVSPSARFAHCMAYDSERGRTVLFGGSYNKGGGPIHLADTWEYDGTTWIDTTPKSPKISPPARQAHGMTYDSARRRIVLFGGFAGALLQDTWEYDGTTWTKMSPAASPPARSGSTLAYDASRQRTVMFGGTTTGGSGGAVNETWEYDGRTWAKMNPATSPPSRQGYGLLAYDRSGKRMVMFGGRTLAGATLGDTWEYASPTLTATPTTILKATGGTQTLTLNAGPGLGNKLYWVFGSMTRTAPGVVLSGVHIPLNPDFYTTFCMGNVTSMVFTNFRGKLSPTGTAIASLNVPPIPQVPCGSKLDHAYVVFNATTGQIFMSSNPVSVVFN